uniref:WxL domain-containing protein n=1 Tax=Listeria costaricensis TaxID=2026604 RepID=UPI000C06D84C
TVTVQDQLETDTKVTLPLPEGLTYQNTYSGNASVTYDAANQQIVIDWLEGQEKQVQITLLAETSGTYSLQASTIREDNPVESAPVSIIVEDVATSETETNAETTTPADDSTETTDDSTANSATSDKSTALQETGKTFNDWFPDPVMARKVAETLNMEPTEVVTEEQLASITELDFELTDSELVDTSGLEYLPNLAHLRFNDCVKLTKLDVSHNPELTSLECIATFPISEIDVSHNPKLTKFYFIGRVFGQESNLTKVDLSHNPNLSSLTVTGTNLTEIDVSHNPNLEFLSVSDNQLTELDVSQNLNLTYFNCSNNQISKVITGQNSLANLGVFEGQTNQLLDFSFLSNSPLTSCEGKEQTPTLPKQASINKKLTIPVDAKDEKGEKMIITPANDGVYDPVANTITWTGLDNAGTVSYSFTSTSGNCVGVVTVPYEATVNLACDDEITYVQGTTKSADDFLTDIHATTDEGGTLASDFATVVNMSQPGDYSVTVTAKDQSLENETSKTVMVHIIPYTLRFSSPPADLTFETSTIENGQQIIKREETTSYNFTVEDTRATDAHWSLTAGIKEPLTSTDGSQLNNALVYKKNGQETILTPGNSVEITNSEEQAKDDADFVVTWQEDEGLLLDVDTNTARSTTYQTTLYWELRDTP